MCSQEKANYILLSIIVLLLSIILILYGYSISGFLSNVLPKAMTTKTAGWMYPNMQSKFGLGWQLTALGYVIVVTFFLNTFWLIFEKIIELLFQKISYGLVLFLLCLATACLYYYLSNPPFFSAGNHWHYLPISEIPRSAYLLLRSIQLLFFDYPFMFTIIIGVLNVVLINLLIGELFKSKWIAALGGISFLISSTMLDFANISEDVQFNILLILLAFMLYSKRALCWFGLAMFVLTLSRSQFALLFPMFIFTEMVTLSSESQKTHGIKWKDAILKNDFLMRNILTFLIPYIIWNVYLLMTDNHFVFSNTHLTQINLLRTIPEKEIEAFTIYPFSFAYSLHFLWVLPIVYHIVNLFILAKIKYLNIAIKRFYIISWLFIISNLIFLDCFVTWYYNYRYLTFYWPLVFVSALSVIDYLRNSDNKKMIATFMVILLTLASTTPHSNCLYIKKVVLKNCFTDLYEKRFALRKLAKNKEIYLSSEYQDSSAKYLSCIMKVPRYKIKVINSSNTLPDDAIVFVKRTNDYVNAHVLICTPNVTVISQDLKNK